MDRVAILLSLLAISSRVAYHERQLVSQIPVWNSASEWAKIGPAQIFRFQIFLDSLKALGLYIAWKETHLQMLTDQFLEQGAPPEEAHAAAFETGGQPYVATGGDLKHEQHCMDRFSTHGSAPRPPRSV